MINPATTANLPPSISSRARWLYPLIIILLGAAVYANALPTPFVFDDNDFILKNTSLHSLAAPTRTLPPYPTRGYMDGNTRPIAFLSFAINYAISGYETWSYHAFSIFIHIAASLTLYGILRRIFLLPHLNKTFGESARILALLMALLWTVHPVNTMAVTYIWQRCESLMGLFYLLTIYCFTRGATTTSRASVWYGATVIACLLGMGTKEAMVSAPLFLLIWDRALLAGSFKNVFKQRRLIHAGLFATLGLLLLLQFNTAEFYENTGVGFTSLHNSWRYFITMPGVYFQYLRLAIWPQPLCLDYRWYRAVDALEIAPYIAPLACAIAATVWAFFKRPIWSLPGCLFFLVLAPTSSIMPLPDAFVEYRLYLPLAALLTAGGCGVYALIAPRMVAAAASADVKGQRRLIILGTSALIILFGSLTIQRNVTYSSDILLWGDVVQQYPDNPRGRYNLARALHARGNETQERGYYEAAQVHYEAGVELAPSSARNLINMGVNLVSLGRVRNARDVFHVASLREPDNDLAVYNYGAMLLALGESAAARQQLKRALELKPNATKTLTKLTEACLLQQDFAAAIQHGEAAVRINPNNASAHFALGVAYEHSSRKREAVQHYKRTLTLEPNHAPAKIRLTKLSAAK